MSTSGNLPLGRGTVRSALRHGFHPPEAQQGGQFQSFNLSTPRGALQIGIKNAHVG
jgi:hypothetical protein